MIDWMSFLRPTRHKKCHFGDVDNIAVTLCILIDQRVCVVLKLCEWLNSVSAIVTVGLRRSLDQAGPR